jgi:hypothetical protein
MSSWLVIQRRFLAQERHRAASLPRRWIQHQTLQRKSRPTNPFDRGQRRRSLASISWKQEDLLLLKGRRLGLDGSKTPPRRSYYSSFHDRSTTAAWSPRCAWLSTEAHEPDEQMESEPDASPLDTILVEEEQSTVSDSSSSTTVDQPPLFDHGSTNATIELKNFLERQVGAFRSSIAFRRIRVLYETEQSSKKKVGWSAVFTCPVTNVMVSSKTLRAKEGCAWEAPIDAHYFDERALATATFFETKNKNRKKGMKNQSQSDQENDKATTDAALVMYTSWPSNAGPRDV